MAEKEQTRAEKILTGLLGIKGSQWAAMTAAGSMPGLQDMAEGITPKGAVPASPEIIESFKKYHNIDNPVVEHPHNVFIPDVRNKLDERISKTKAWKIYENSILGKLSNIFQKRKLKSLGFSETNMPRWGHVYVDKNNVAAVLHELGHAVDLKKSPILKSFAAYLPYRYGPIVGASMLSSDKTRDYAVPVVAASMVPTLASEASASIKALKFLKKYDKPAFASSAKLLAKTFGTYGLAATGAIGGTALAANYINKRK